MIELAHHPRVLRLLAGVECAYGRLEREWPQTRRIAAQRRRFYDRIWQAAAVALGANITELDDGLLEIEYEGRRTRVFENTTPLDDPVTLLVAGNKPLVLQRLAEQGLPVPRHASFSIAEMPAAIEFMRAVGGPCVVKPAKNTGAGKGVTTGIRNGRALTRAAIRAAAAGSALMIEEQIAGANYRLLYLDGELLDAVERRPPVVVGDGRRTVRALVNEANAARGALGEQAGQAALHFDLEMRQTLAGQNLRAGSIPAQGQTVVVKTAVNDNSALENVAAVERVCPEIIKTGALAAAAIGARLVGVDVITTDIGRPLRDTGGVILELNTTPGLYYHYHQQGAARAVAEPILRRLLGLRAVHRPVRATDIEAAENEEPLTAAAF